MSLHMCAPPYIMLRKAFHLGFTDLIFRLFPQVGSFKSWNHYTGGQGIGFSSTKDGRDPFSLFFSLVPLDAYFSSVPRGVRNLGEREGDPVCLYIKTCTCSADLAPRPHLLAYIGFQFFRVFSLTCFELLFCDHCPLHWASSTLCHTPLPHPHCTSCSSGLLWFSFSFSSASTDRAIGVAARQLAGAAC